MFFDFTMLTANVTLGSNEATADTTQAAIQAAQQQGGAGLGTIGMILYIVGLIALFWFLAIRPQRKREKELKVMQDGIKVGDWVMTSSGFYGKVVDVTEQVVMVEFGTNKSVNIPVKKSEIIGNKEPNLTNKPSEDDEKKK